MGENLKSALEIAMEKAKKMGGQEEISLSPAQREEIAEIRKVYTARIAEAEILIQDKEKLEMEIDRLRRERDRKIESAYQKGKER